MTVHLLAALAFACTCPAFAWAHDFWSNGEPVPAWVKAECCGPRDVHHLRPSAVHIAVDGYHVDGLRSVIPFSRTLPSPDGQYWGFWNSIGEPDPAIY